MLRHRDQKTLNQSLQTYIRSKHSSSVIPFIPDPLFTSTHLLLTPQPFTHSPFPLKLLKLWTSLGSPLRFEHSSSAIPFNLYPPSPLTSWYTLNPSSIPFPLIKNRVEKGHPRSTSLVPHAFPFNPSHSSPLTPHLTKPPKTPNLPFLPQPVHIKKKRKKEITFDS